MSDRNRQLILPEQEFVQECCTLEFFKSSGAGGQHRNKTSSAVRITHVESGLRAEDCSERSQHRNRSNAVAKLKLAIALKMRETPKDTLPRMECSVNAPDYPLFVAELFDILSDSGFDHRTTAQICGISPTALLKKLFRDPAVWQEFCLQRESRGLPRLHI